MSDRQSAWWIMDGGLWHCTAGRDQDHPKKKKCRKTKWLSEEALQIAEKRRQVKPKEKRKDISIWFQRIARRDKKAFLTDQCKETEENNGMGKTRDLVKTITDTKGIFHARMGTIKDRNIMDLTVAEILRRGGKTTQKNYTKKSSWPR